jgi:hypothetical protein
MLTFKEFTFHDTFFTNPCLRTINRHWSYVKASGHLLISRGTFSTAPSFSLFADVVPPALCYALIRKMVGDCGECPSYAMTCPIAAMFNVSEGYYAK